MFEQEPWQSMPPDGMQHPLDVEVTIRGTETDQMDKAALMKLAKQIIDEHYSSVMGWVQGLRRAMSNLPMNYAARELELPGLVARWVYNSTIEQLLIVVTPQSGGKRQEITTDINLDGYVLWVHSQPGYPNDSNTGVPQVLAPYFIVFNGYVLESQFYPEQPCGGYPVLFGSTALRSQSYVGDIEQKNPLATSTVGLATPVIPPPGWGKYDGGTAADGVTNQDPINKELGYWLFDWLNADNPFQYTEQESVWKNWARSSNSDIPKFSKGLYFKKPTQSILKPQGLNRIAIGPAVANTIKVPTIDVICAEFYSRSKFRIVNQSWKYSRPGLRVNVNDSPLMWGVATGSGTVF